MKTFKLFIIPIVAINLLMLASCGGGDDPVSETERVLNLLTGSWSIQSVTVDGTTQTNQFTGLTLNFTATNYSTTNGKVVWPTSGTWTFTDDSATALLRNDGLEISIVEITSSQLKLALQWQGSIGPGRIGSLSGQHQFTFIKD